MLFLLLDAARASLTAAVDVIEHEDEKTLSGERISHFHSRRSGADVKERRSLLNETRSGKLIKNRKQPTTKSEYQKRCEYTATKR